MDGYNKSFNGYNAEHFVMDAFQKQGFNVEYKDDYYDINVWCASAKNGHKKIEIKSCHLIVKIANGKNGEVLDYGRFSFDSLKNRTMQRSNNVDVCLVVCINGCFEIIGFISAKSLNAKKYVSLKKAMNRKLTRFNKYIDKLNNG